MHRVYLYGTKSRLYSLQGQSRSHTGFRSVRGGGVRGGSLSCTLRVVLYGTKGKLYSHKRTAVPLCQVRAQFRNIPTLFTYSLPEAVPRGGAVRRRTAGRLSEDIRNSAASGGRVLCGKYGGWIA